MQLLVKGRKAKEEESLKGFHGAAVHINSTGKSTRLSASREIYPLLCFPTSHCQPIPEYSKGSAVMKSTGKEEARMSASAKGDFREQIFIVFTWIH